MNHTRTNLITPNVAWVLCLLFLAFVFPASASDVATTSGTAVPLDQATAAAILASAHESANKISDPTQRYNNLVELAESSLRIQDKDTARKVLAEAKVSSAGVKIQDFTLLKFIKLSAQAGDEDGALASAQTVAGTGRINALGAVGESMAQNGNISGAMKVSRLINSITEADVKPSAGEGQIVWAPGTGHSLTDQIAFAQSKIGIALATYGDLTDARTISQSIPKNVDLLGSIVTAERKAGQSEAAAKTSANIMALINEAPKDNFFIERVRRAAEIFGRNDDIADAKTVIGELPAVPGSYTEQQIRDLASSQVIKSIAKSGDTLHAIKMLDLLAEDQRGSALLAIGMAQQEQGHMQEAHLYFEQAYKSEVSGAQSDLANMKDLAERATEFKRSEIIEGHVEELVSLGKAMAKQGDTDYAKKILSSAYTCVLYVHAPVNPSEMFMKVVTSQIDIGAFADAIVTVNKIEAINRMQFIIRMINEEVKRNDKQALSETVPVAMKAAQEAPPLAERGQASLAETLSAVGYKDEAKIILEGAEKNAQSSAGWQKMDQLAALKTAQVTMGDEAGKVQTTEQMQEETRQFDAEIAKISASAQTNGNKQINIPEAIKLVQQAQTSANQEEGKQYINRALEMVGNNGQLLESLIYISARYHPPNRPESDSQNLVSADQLILKNDFPAALKQIDTMTGSGRDSALVRLSRAELDAGQYKLAFETANSIGDPALRAPTLIHLLSSK